GADVLFYTGHVLFSRPKKCVWQGFQNRPGFCLVGFLCFLWVFQKLVFTPIQVLERVSPFTFHLLTRALTVERTVIGRPPSQCCQMYDNYPPNRMILSLLV